MGGVFSLLSVLLLLLLFLLSTFRRLSRLSLLRLELLWRRLSLPSSRWRRFLRSLSLLLLLSLSLFRLPSEYLTLSKPSLVSSFTSATQTASSSVGTVTFFSVDLSLNFSCERRLLSSPLCRRRRSRESSRLRWCFSRRCDFSPSPSFSSFLRERSRLLWRSLLREPRRSDPCSRCPRSFPRLFRSSSSFSLRLTLVSESAGALELDGPELDFISDI
mmetsp:Transcript_6177/g.9252  ORF Transcript_6177/g.9252 Transcript_6177/m.9252 type:complete len:217 (-) Transcript_6177:127-777(-)